MGKSSSKGGNKYCHRHRIDRKLRFVIVSIMGKKKSWRLFLFFSNWFGVISIPIRIFHERMWKKWSKTENWGIYRSDGARPWVHYCQRSEFQLTQPCLFGPKRAFRVCILWGDCKFDSSRIIDVKFFLDGGLFFVFFFENQERGRAPVIFSAR